MTVVFIEIVGSAALAAQLGDQRSRELLDRVTGDGTPSTFDGPARAVDCACAVRDTVRKLGLQVRCGLHTGEIELRGSDIGGIAVEIAARVAAKAGPSEIFVSQTLTDLAAGSGIRFEPRGSYELKGVPGSWPLNEVLRASRRGPPPPTQTVTDTETAEVAGPPPGRSPA